MTPTELSSITYKDLSAMVNAYTQIRKTEIEADRVNSARTAWLMGSDAGKTFGEYCEKYGLTERTDKPEKVDTTALYQMAEKITEQLKG